MSTIINGGLGQVETQLSHLLKKEIPIYIQIGEDGYLHMVGSINPFEADPDEPASMVLAKFLEEVANALADGLTGE